MELQRTRNQRLKNLDVGIENNKRLAESMKNHDMGIIPVAIDTRSTYEKQQDKIYVEHEMRKKVYNLFNNDPQFSEQFMDKLKSENMGYAQFENVYDPLIKQFKSTLSQPNMVFDTMKKLIDNFGKTGVATSAIIPSSTNGNMITYLTEVRQMIEDQYTKGNVGKQEGDDMANKLDALLYIFSKGNIDMDLFNRYKAGFSQRLGIKEVLQDIIETLMSDEPQNLKVKEFKTHLSKLKENTFYNLEKSQLKEENSQLRNNRNKYPAKSVLYETLNDQIEVNKAKIEYLELKLKGANQAQLNDIKSIIEELENKLKGVSQAQIDEEKYMT